MKCTGFFVQHCPKIDNPGGGCDGIRYLAAGCTQSCFPDALKLSCGTHGEPEPLLRVCFRAALMIISDGDAPFVA